MECLEEHIMAVRGHFKRYRVNSPNLPRSISGVSPGQVVTNEELADMHSGRYNGKRTAHTSISRATKKACRDGLLEECRDEVMDETLPSIVRWQQDLGAARAGREASSGTAITYKKMLRPFNLWLKGKKFEVVSYENNDGMLKEKREQRGFENVESLLKYTEEPLAHERYIQRIIKSYLRDPMHDSKKASSMAIIKCAILSYFKSNECPLQISYDPRRHHDTSVAEISMSLSDLASMISVSKVRDRTILLCLFQRGLDISTMAEKFNYEAFGQMAEWFGSVRHDEWDIKRTPVPITLVRKKTRYRHVGFLDSDAVQAIKEYLDVRREYTGRDILPGEPVFATKSRGGITSKTIATRFVFAAKRAGVLQGEKWRGLGPHELRDLLKSTLIDSGCRIDVADHVIGHKPKDSYEKQAILYPDTLRTEYAKASDMLNIITKSTRHINQRESVKGTITLPGGGMCGEIRGAGIRPTGTTTACLNAGAKTDGIHLCQMLANTYRKGMPRMWL